MIDLAGTEGPVGPEAAPKMRIPVAESQGSDVSRGRVALEVRAQGATDQDCKNVAYAIVYEGFEPAP